MARFIVIDDFPDAAETLVIVGRLLGHEGLALTSGKHVVRDATEFGANVVVTDIQMPDIDGFGVAREVRKHLPGVLLIGFSGGIHLYAHPDVSLFDLAFQKPIGMPGMEQIATMADERVRDGGGLGTSVDR